MSVIEFVIRLVLSPFFAIGQLAGAILWVLVGWVRFVAFGGEFIWYKNPNERKTIADVFDQLEELNHE